jgi:LPS export ABC transporter protein LptC
LRKYIPTKAGGVLIFFLSILLLLVFNGCSRNKGTRANDKASPTSSPSVGNSAGIDEDGKENVPIEFKKTTLQSREGNRKIWVLQADKVEYNEKTQITRAEEVKVEFYNDREQLVLTLKAIGAVANVKEKSLKFEGAVNATTPDGDELYVRELKWDGNEKKLIGKRTVRLVRKGVVMEGENMTADPELMQLEFSGDVKIIYPDMDNFLNF